MRDSRSRSIGVVILLGVCLFYPGSALGTPFSVVAPRRLAICSSSGRGTNQWPGRFEAALGWIVVGDEVVPAENMRGIEVEHQSSSPDVQVRSELLLDGHHGGWGRTALGGADKVALAAFPWWGLQLDDSKWIWSWSWPEGHQAIERLSTLVRLGSHDARFETEVVFDPECNHPPKAGTWEVPEPAALRFGTGFSQHFDHDRLLGRASR